MDFIDDLERLQKLRESGALNDDEYAAAKARLLHEHPQERPCPNPPPPSPPLSPEALERETRQWAMYLHLSQLAVFVVPPAGVIAPLLIWQLKKAELPGLDVHGKNAVNWVISAVIYAAISSALIPLFFIGLPLIVVVAVLDVVFAVLAASKANNGEVWKYPLAITFIR